MEEKPLVVDFRPTREDLFRLRLIHGQFFWRMGLALVVILLASHENISQVFGGQATAKERSDLLIMLLVGVLVCGVSACLCMLFFWREAGILHQEMDEVMGNCTLAISPNGLLWSAQEGADSLPWSAVARLHAIPGYISLFLHGGGAFFIPRRAFNSPKDAERFLQAAKAWRKAATMGSG